MQAEKLKLPNKPVFNPVRIADPKRDPVLANDHAVWQARQHPFRDPGVGRGDVDALQNASVAEKNPE